MTDGAPRRAVRIANCSGFYGDRIDAVAELLAGPDPFDVLTGDYLAELTMGILAKAKARDTDAGYASTFVRQMRGALDELLERGIKVVTNAGGLNPHGLARKLHELQPDAKIAVVDGDDVAALVDLTDVDDVVAAHAYLGSDGIAAALRGGAEVVICGRVTDAALVVGPAAWWHDWGNESVDAFAGAVVAGHVIECGAQCTGGNYPYLHELAVGLPGFPIAEVHHDGTSVITKQPGTGGAVTIGTVTAQLLYEIGAPVYPTPDGVAFFDTAQLETVGADRVRIYGVRGAPAPRTTKVGVTVRGGFRNTVTVMVTGLDIEQKAAHVTAQLEAALGGWDQFDEYAVELARPDTNGASDNVAATVPLRITVKSHDRDLVGRRFADAVVGLALSSIAGFFVANPPTAATEFAVFTAKYIPNAATAARVTHHDGRVESIPARSGDDSWKNYAPQKAGIASAPVESTVAVPLGRVCGARSGDKGGDANVGVWTDDERWYQWLADYLTVARFQSLVPDAASLPVERFDFPNLQALNFVVHRILGDGVAACTRTDAQAKGLGEFLRSRIVDVPASLWSARSADARR